MQKKWIALSEKLLKTGKYHEARLTPRRLSGRYYAGRAVIRETFEETGNRTILAYAALWRTFRKDWYELGTVWVDEALRGNGLREKLMTEAVELAPDGANIFLITNVESIMRSAERLGFVVATTGTRPGISRWASDVGIVCRLPKTIYPIRPMVGDAPPAWGMPASGQRWMFVRPAKAHAE